VSLEFYSLPELVDSYKKINGREKPEENVERIHAIVKEQR
jgi:hypothetical protein